MDKGTAVLGLAIFIVIFWATLAFSNATLGNFNQASEGRSNSPRNYAETSTTTIIDTSKSTAKAQQEYGDSAITMTIGISNAALPTIATGVTIVIIVLAGLIFLGYHLGKRKRRRVTSSSNPSRL